MDMDGSRYTFSGRLATLAQRLWCYDRAVPAKMRHSHLPSRDRISCNEPQRQAGRRADLFGTTVRLAMTLRRREEGHLATFVLTPAALSESTRRSDGKFGNSVGLRGGGKIM